MRAAQVIGRNVRLVRHARIMRPMAENETFHADPLHDAHDAEHDPSHHHFHKIAV